MDEHSNGVGIASDEELVDQLRQYADALAARASGVPIVVRDLPDNPVPKGRTPILAMAAGVLVLIGAAAWVGSRNDANSIRSTSDDQTQTTADDLERNADDETADNVIATSPLMADPDQWVISEAYPTQTSPGRDSGGTWAWRLDDHVFLLLDGVGLDDLGPLNRADVEAGDGRVMIGWLDGDDRLGLQGYGVDEPTLRAVAAALQPTESGWRLPGAEVLVAETGGRSDASESTQVGYSPVDSDGTADLSKVVTSVRRQGTEADLYRELFDASSLGTVAESTVGGQAGYLITGPFGSYSLAFGDGWVSSWQTMSPDVDLADMLGSVRPVTEQEWDEAVARTDDIVEQAVAASIADLDGGVDLADPGDDPDLPRYDLPEPWTFQWVTDMGLWSAEERAQREALSAAHAPPGGFAELIWTQGFVQSNPSTDRADSLPFAMPELFVQVYRREHEDPIVPEPPGSETLSFAGLNGHIERMQMHDPTSASGSRTEIRIAAAQGPLFVSIEAPFVDEATIRRFAEGLSIRNRDLSQGVNSTNDDFEQLLELPGETGNGAGFFSRWSAAYTTGSEQDRPEASLSVESLTFEQLQVEMMRSTSRGADYKPVAGGRYLANQYEREESLTFDDDDNPVIVDDPQVTKRTSLLRYDPDKQILVSLDIEDELDAAIAMMEELTEIDIDTWRQKVEPYNAKPLQPR